MNEVQALPGRIRFAGGHGESAFETALRREVGAYLAGCGGGRRATSLIAAKAALFGGVAAICYGLVIGGGLRAPAALAAATGYGIAVLLLAINVGHDAAHGCVTGRRRLDRAIHLGIFTLLGVDGALWQRRHVGSHHVFPNVTGCDADIDSNPFLRLSPRHERRPWQRWQHLYAPAVYAIVALHSILVQDFQYLGRRRLANMVEPRRTPREIAGFLGRKLAYFALTLGAPMVFSGFAPGAVLAGWLLMNAGLSLVFVFLLVGTHFAVESAFPAPDADGMIATSWVEHQLATSVDWSPHSRLAHFIAGGVNAHAAHHLFPSVSHAHHRAIAGMIERLAVRYGAHYVVTTLPRLAVSHLRFLRSLALEDSPSPSPR